MEKENKKVLPTFKIGDYVMYSKLGKEKVWTKISDRKGYIHSFTGTGVPRVKWEGTQNPQAINPFFIEHANN